MQAIILAGGMGKRLARVLESETPKPMAPLHGRPLLAHTLGALKAQGVKEAMLAVCYKKEAIRAYFGYQFEGMRLYYAEEHTPLGTGGALKAALEALNPQAPVVVMNGDCLIETDVAAMHYAHIQTGAMLTMAVREMQDCSRYGEVTLADDRRIEAFTYPGHARPGWISAGTYVVSPFIFEGFTLPDAFSFESDFQHPFCDYLRPLAWPVHGYFIDIGLPEDYAQAKRDMQERLKETL